MDSVFGSGLLTDIFLVLIVSITRVQTKEIKNSSSIVFQQISETHQNSSIELSSSTVSDSRSHHNNALENFIRPTVQSINTSTAIASNGNASFQRAHDSAKQQQQIRISTTDASGVKHFDLNYSIDNNDSISLHNDELAQFELPTQIIHSRFYSLETSAAAPNHQQQQQQQLFARNAKHSNILRSALRAAARQGFEAMVELYDKKEPNLISKGLFLPNDHPGAILSQFSSPISDETQNSSKAAYAALFVAKSLKNSLNIDFSERSRETPPKISLRRTTLEGFCPPRDQPFCTTASRRYRTHDGTCNNARKGRWGAAQMPFNRFQQPAYRDGIEELRESIFGGPLPSPRLVSLLVHGSRESEAPVTLMLAQFGQFIDHDLTATLQPRSVNGSVPQCCGVSELHPSCAPIRVPTDDPWLAPLGIRCLEFLRSAPAQRRDCLLSWREQTNQVTSYLDGSTIYSSSDRSSERSRLFSNGLLVYGRGPPRDDVCLRGAFDNQCVRAGDSRSGEQPGLLAMHHAWVLEHNRIASELAELNLHWSDEKLYQETRRIIGAMIQHITYREFLPLVLGREVCKLFDLELQSTGHFKQYDVRVNPTVANSFAAAAFRFGHSLIQNTYMRSTRNYEFIDNNVTLHEENFRGDIGSPGSLHRLLRGLSIQRAQKRDEFISSELTNHLFQSGSFPFGLDLAAINIQRGRDHGLPAYTQWREPCGLSPIIDWDDLERVVGPKSAERMQNAYKSVDDIDLFVGGLAERPVVGGLVGPVFACIIAQQFSNLRKGDRFWYENGDFESSFTPAQLQSIRQVNFAQVVCRSLGSGVLQPHIFLPHTVLTNERIPCGFGTLAPIDLGPWLERDPFLKNSQHQLNNSSAVVELDDKIIINLNKLRPSSSSTLKNKIDIRDRLDEDVFLRNTTTINNKIDLDTTRSHFNKNGQSNKTSDKLDKLNTGRKTHTNEPTQTKIKTKPKTTTTTAKTKTKTKPTTSSTETTVRRRRQRLSTKRTKKRTNRNERHKRDLTNDDDINDSIGGGSGETGRSSIIIKIDKDTEDITATKTPFNEHKDNRRIDKDHKHSQKKEYVIVTPDDQNAYDIEIKIKEKKPQNNDRIMIDTNNEPNSYYDTFQTTTNKKPMQFYQVPQPSIVSDGGQYGGMQNDDSLQQPHQKPTDTYATYGPIIVVNKRTTTTHRPTIRQTTSKTKTTTRQPYVYGQQQQDETASKPYYTTKRPNFGYGANDDSDPLFDDDQPFYTYPSVQNTDASSYYAPTTADDHDNEFISIIQNDRPYQTKPQQQNTPYLDRPSATAPSYANSNNNNNNNNYGQLDDEQLSYGQNVRPTTHIQNNDYGPTYLDDFATKPPDKIPTTYVVQQSDDSDDGDDLEEDNDFVQNGYGGFTTNRPHFDLTTFYAVQTTKKKKRPVSTTRRPTRPAYGAQNDENDDDSSSDDDDDDDDYNDDDDDDNDENVGYFNPSSVFSNIVSTFNGYFGTQTTTTTITTTRKPYITVQNDDNFYTHPSLPADFPYSRERNIRIGKDVEETKQKQKRKRKSRSSRDIEHDFEQYDMTTYRSAYPTENVDFHDDTYENDTKVIAFDRDGYLRPEYMNYDGQMPNINTKIMFSNSMMDDLNANRPPDMTIWHAMNVTTTTNANRHEQKPKPEQETFENFYVHHLLNGHYYNDERRHKQIITLTDNDRNNNNNNNAQSVHNGAATRTTTHRPFGLVPINVLTKPERPDDWVIYDAEQHRTPLPRMPLIKTDYEENTNDMPRPMIARRYVRQVP